MSLRDFDLLPRLGPAIKLDTQFGPFQAAHIQVGDREGVALKPINSSESTDPALIRVQSSCLFSESFRTTDCDCALQLLESMRRISANGGVIIYLYEEGRNAGLEKKMEAIRLEQNLGLTSKAAYARLGLEGDNRKDYGFIANIVEEFYGKHRWILLSNNPAKEALLRASGIDIVRTESLICHSGDRQIKSYLEGKALQFGHRID